MRSSLTGHVTPQEWRWAILVSCSLVLLAFSPFLWVLVAGITGSDSWSFMGMLHDHTTGAANLSQLFQGSEGHWLTLYLHTPEPHNPALIDPLYVLLGQISRLTGLSPIVVFHVARVGAALAMYMALYQLASTIWMRVRSRRIFFTLAGIGSGLGWLIAPFMESSRGLMDLTVPGAFPFFSSLTSVHLPLAIACLALLAGIIIIVVRPDDTPPPTVQNGGVLVFGLSLILVFIYPLAFAPISAAFVINLIRYWIHDRRVNRNQINWLLWYGVQTLPMLLYYAFVLRENDIIATVWRNSVYVEPPPVHLLVLSFGIPLVLALPGIYRGLRRFESDGDQFMLLWLAVILIMTYLPIPANASFLIGVMIPLTYFATRALEDFWFPRLPRRWWIRSVVALLPIIFISNLLMLILPLFAINEDNLDNNNGILLQRDYVELFNWMEDRTGSDDVIMAASETGLWIPGWIGSTVVSGHPRITLDYDEKNDAIREWYRVDDVADCADTILSNSPRTSGRDYPITFVIYGPEEQALGPAVCRRFLTLAAVFGDVRLYSYVATQYPAE